jgi:hypothetical protein
MEAAAGGLARESAQELDLARQLAGRGGSEERGEAVEAGMRCCRGGVRMRIRGGEEEAAPPASPHFDLVEAGCGVGRESLICR